MQEPLKIAVLGAGGFAREVEWLLREINRAESRPLFVFQGFLVTDLSQIKPTDSADRVLGDLSWLESNLQGVDALAIGIANPLVRARLGREVQAQFPSISLPPLVHPSVLIDGSSTKIGNGVILCAGVIGTVNVTLGDFVAVHVGCTIGHEAKIGCGSNINPGANVSGGVNIGESVLVGTGAQILQYLDVRDRATIGAGAVVTRDVDEGATVVGVPAAPIRRKGAPTGEAEKRSA